MPRTAGFPDSKGRGGPFSSEKGQPAPPSGFPRIPRKLSGTPMVGSFPSLHRGSLWEEGFCRGAKEDGATPFPVLSTQLSLGQQTPSLLVVNQLSRGQGEGRATSPRRPSQAPSTFPTLSVRLSPFSTAGKVWKGCGL